MKKELKGIKKDVKALISSLKDADKNHGYNLSIEKDYAEKILSQVNSLLLHFVINNEVAVCMTYEPSTNTGIYPKCKYCGHEKERHIN